ncbi:MAG: VanZ family protein [Lachnospiraceae bacterium]|nr:VanZ family protein [Lachnospiraceae bacterium]
MRTFLKPLSFLPAILMMYLIFTFSAQDGTASSQLSHNVCTRVVSAGNTLLDLEMDTWQIDSYAGKMEFLVRKCAHMIEYFLLAIAVSFPLYVYGLHGILLMLLAGGICIGYACLDEYHQSMVMGRYATPRDVCVDAIGVFIGIIVVRIIGWTGRHTIFRDNSSARQTRELDQARREIDQLRREQARMQRELSRQERSSKHETDRRQAHRTEPKRDPRFDDPNFDPRFDDPH